ncbi:unnamed protein product, partial [Rotaria socialis]
PWYYPLGPNCFNPSALNCFNNSLCPSYASCGTQCLQSNQGCSNNLTICSGFNYWNTNLQVCGSQQQCYDKTTNVCINGTIRCLNSCNGICYSNSQYCYNNAIVCNNNELICNVIYNTVWYAPLGPNCYNPSQLNCFSNLLCPSYLSCGTQCISWQEGCANNQTICPSFYYWNTKLQVWSPQQLCYDSTTNACANGTAICSLSYTRLCGLKFWNPDSQYCINNSLQCINSCGGICYSNSQYCYNNAIICNNGQSVCDVTYNPWQYYPFGLNCYNSSNLNCLTHGTIHWVLIVTTHPNIVVLTTRFAHRIIHVEPNVYNIIKVVLTIEQSVRASTIEIPTCNFVVLSNSATTIQLMLVPTELRSARYRIRNYAEQIAGIQPLNIAPMVVLGVSIRVMAFVILILNIAITAQLFATTANQCYNASQLKCLNNSLCPPNASCASQCLQYNQGCANNRTICSGFYYWNINLQVCGAQQCYDPTNTVCLGNNGTVCPIGSQLCSGSCYFAQGEYCVGGSNTVYCLNNPSSLNCSRSSSTLGSSTAVPSGVTTTVSTTRINGTSTTSGTTYTVASGSCCAIRNCTTDSGCCQPMLLECQCYRLNQTDAFGSCVSPNSTSVSGNTCPVQGRCILNSDCCKCECATVSYIDSSGNQLAKKQCIPR